MTPIRTTLETPEGTTNADITRRLDRLDSAVDCLAMLAADNVNVNRLARRVGALEPVGRQLLEILAEIRVGRVQEEA
jgi:hypothetical protein